MAPWTWWWWTPWPRWHRQALIEQQFEHPLTFSIVAGFRGSGNQQNELAALTISIGQEPVKRFAERTAVDRFKNLGQFACHDQRALRTKSPGQRFDRFENTVRCFVEDQRIGQFSQLA